MGGTSFAPTELRPSAFPHPVTRLEVRETHISWIVLTGPYAYKLKKPVHLDFIDASTLVRRYELCHEELRLNRRLAAELYVDVVPVTRQSSGLRIGGTGEIVDYAVRMHQFDPSQELHQLLERGEVGAGEIATLALDIARFHESAPRARLDPSFANTLHLHDAMVGTLRTLSAHLGERTAAAAVGALRAWMQDQWQDKLGLLRGRERGGAIRECHGDLHARNIVRWKGRLLPFDCLEFDPNLRWIDVMSDVAFLAMDLTAHGRRDLSFSFLNHYLEHTGDYQGVRLLSFYAVYRALVRAMVDALAAAAERSGEAIGRLKSRLKAAAAHMPGTAHTIYLMHGVSGSGKSWMSERLAPRMGAVRIRSDVERKRIAGPAAGDRARAHELYGSDMNERTYCRLLDCARACLEGGTDAMVDATFLKIADRRRFAALAEDCAADWVILDCAANREALKQRIEGRMREGTDPSDAGVEVLARQLDAGESLTATELARTVRIDTQAPGAEDAAVTALQSRASAHRH